ncbi:C-type lectin 37Da [Anopheles gambiae]|uniref:C-type lectin domain-containing protein n=1 Tax=Anopheles coluzzii TaxID=1518534 RepID=A0A6E8VSG7_ANOCL|nr:C-type lectin 37Da-like [Anopheles coluzzii]XP_049463375.1 C-type lectin 37Da-like [Anopheles coluzzii]XP_061507568.1 C-type lectin 37Da [Anopheles gambiae]XP_061507569.1 C-type lectin 37Da [Anopheles gambiae]
MARPLLSPIILLFMVSTLFRLSASNREAIGYRVLQQKSYYLGTTFRLNWHKAAAFCRSQGLFLVSINSQSQLDEVIEYVNKSGFFNANESNLQLWTSGNDLGEKNQFLWTSTGERITFNQWTQGEPNHAQVGNCTVEHCVVLQHYQNGLGATYSFDDRACEWQYYFMCESLDG